jgi:SAM-dependent methyltransferase
VSKTSRRLAEIYRFGLEKQQRAWGYTIDRRLESPNKEMSYARILPAWQGQNVAELLETLAAAGPINLLDVGCGLGNFLVDVRQRFGPAVNCRGITTFPYHNPSITQKHGVDIDLTDIQQLRSRDTYDLITAVHSLPYTQNPLLALKRIHDALKPSGIALISPFTFSMERIEDEKRLIQYLERQYGLAITPDHKVWLRGWKIAFAKTGGRLSLPVALAGFLKADPTDGLTKVTYRLVNKADNHCR